MAIRRSIPLFSTSTKSSATRVQGSPTDAGNTRINQSDSAARTAHYYDRVQWLYTYGWTAGGTRSLHYGLWWDDTKNLGEAIANGDRFIGDRLRLGPDDHVLDMGCGVGGTSIYLAQRHGCRATGITLSKVQLAQARKRARRLGLTDRVQFELMDYTRTSFPEVTFTKAFTQESSNYPVEKLDLLREVYRVLKPGGQYVSLDPYLRRDVREGEEAERLARVLRGWACPGLERFDRYSALAQQAGLQVIESKDVNDHGKQSAEIIWRRHVRLRPLVEIGRRLGLVSADLKHHFEAAIFQRDMHCDEDNLLIFGYLLAEKPSAS